MKKEEEILTELLRLEDDERLARYSSADVFSNAPLALIQVELEAKATTLRWVLDKERIKYPIK